LRTYATYATKDYIDPSQLCYNAKRDWLTNRFEAIVGQIKRTGLNGMPIDELCKEAAEVACWLGQSMAEEMAHGEFAQRVEPVKVLKEAPCPPKR
jgi:hypothetical protein